MFESDQHASESLYAWYNQNKVLLLVFIIILFGGTFLTQSWLEQKAINVKNASLAYSDLLKEFNSTTADENKLQHDANNIIYKYPKTPYADLAKILSAKIFVNKADIKNAALIIEGVLKHSAQPALKDISRLRLARIYLDNQQVDLAKKQLDSVSQLSKTSSLYYLLQGDVAYLEQNFESASKNYESALQFFPVSLNNSVLNKVIRAKLYQANSSKKPV